MKTMHVISYGVLIVILAFSGLSAGCATGKNSQQVSEQSQPSPVGPVNIAKANTALKGPATPVSDHMWRTYAARGQAFANCGGSAVATAQRRTAGTGARRQAKKAKKSAPAPQKPVTAELICPEGCVPATKAGQRGTPPSLGSAAPAVSAPSAQAPSPVQVTTVTASPAPPQAATPPQSPAAVPVVQDTAPAPAAPAGQIPTPAAMAPASAAPQTPAPAAQASDSGAQQSASGAAASPVTAPPVPSGASLGSLGNSSWQSQGTPPPP